MSMRYCEKIRNRQLEAIVDALGPAATLRLFSGSVPADCEAPNPTGELAEVELPRRPFKMPLGGVMEISDGPWLGEAHDTGTAKSFRIQNYFGETLVQGSVSSPDGDGDLKLDPAKMERGQRLSIAGFTFNMRERG
jgi:hypothetical protein